tara:strand:+ start:1327 stop:1689 length:363 start_codon:yes stop_codon:yes gene_type:complete
MDGQTWVHFVAENSSGSGLLRKHLQVVGVSDGTFDHTSYTHGWLRPDFDKRHLTISMASIDPHSPAKPQGARTYRVLADGEGPGAGEITCPNTTTSVKCIDCGLCAGTSRKAKNVVIGRI